MEWWKTRAWNKPWSHLVYTVRPREAKWLAQVVNVIQMVTGWAGARIQVSRSVCDVFPSVLHFWPELFPRVCCNACDDVKAFSQSRNPSWTSLVVRESARQCRGHKFDPWSGKTPRATEQLNRCPTITKPMRCNCCHRVPRAHALQSDATARRSPHSPQLGKSLCTAMKTQHNQK